VVAKQPIGEDTDDIFFDPERKRSTSSAERGGSTSCARTIRIIIRWKARSAPPRARRTGLFVPEEGRPLRGRTGNRNITRQTAYLSTSLNLQKGSSLAHATEHVLLRTSKKEYIMKRKERRYFHVFHLSPHFVVAGWLGWQPARAEGDSKELQAVAQALGKNKVSLLAGIRQASQGSARAISAKFELEDGKLSLSVYTAEKGLAVPAERMSFRS